MSDLINIFADGIARISVRAGVARIALGTQEEKEEGAVAMNPTHQLFLPVDGFLQTFNVMQNMVKKMEDQGMIKKKADETPEIEIMDD